MIRLIFCHTLSVSQLDVLCDHEPLYERRSSGHEHNLTLEPSMTMNLR